MNIGGNDLLSQIENDHPKLGVYLRRYILPSIQARGLAGHVLATPADKPGPVELQPLSDIAVKQVAAGPNVSVASVGGVATVTAKGSVTSVGLAAPARQTVTGSPVTSSGTITVTDNPQAANLVFAGPVSGPPAEPAFRLLVAADVPGTGGFDGTFTTLAGNDDVTPAAGAAITQIEANLIVQGGGFNLGNAGGWSNSFGSIISNFFARRGITQSRGSRMDKHAIGDAAAFYGYVFTDGGIAAQSDEGQCAITGQMTEYGNYFHGTVSSTTGTGDTVPVLAFTSGNNWTTDGGYLLNITKGTLSGTLTGASAALSLTINSGVVATFLNKLTVSGASLPVSTAIGIATDAIAPAATTRDIPVPVTVTVNLAQIGGIYHLFTNGSVVTVAGINYPEQSIVSSASALLPGNQQTFTLHVCNPNSQAIIFQGGIQGQYISPDANLAMSGQRGAYFAFGSLLGTDLIYGNQVGGGIANNILPDGGCMAWQATGVNSAWHLYPGAEVTANTNQNFDCKIEQNGVAWAASDVVECTHFPTGGGATAFFVRNQFSPSNSGFGVNGLAILMDGAGIAGGNSSGAVIRNNYTPANYSGSGGPLQAPMGIKLVGTYASSIYISQAPDAGSIIFVSGNNNAGSNITDVINLNFGGSGHLTYNLSTQRWHVDRMDSAVFSASGTDGISATIPVAPVAPLTVAGSATYTGGILTAYTPPS